MEGVWQHVINAHIPPGTNSNTAKRKHWWRTMGKQEFLLPQKPHGDFWGDGTRLQPGAWPGQEGNRMIGSAHVNKRLS